MAQEPTPGDPGEPHNLHDVHDPLAPDAVGGSGGHGDPGGVTGTVGPSTAAVTPLSATVPRRPGRRQLAAWSAAVVFAAVAGRFAALSAPAEFAVLGAGVLIFARAVRTPVDRRLPTADRVDGRGSLAWLGLLAVFLAWEFFALSRGSTPAHPTLSILLGPLLAEPLLRSAGYLVWLAAGVWIAKR